MGMSRLEFEGDRDRFAAQIGRRCGSTRIAPPRIANQMLAGNRKTNERFDIARVASERSKEPLLSLDTELGAQFSLECRPRAGETLADPKLRIRGEGGAAARLMQNQDVKHSDDLVRYLGLD